MNESIDQYYTRLRSMGKRCDFADIDFEIMLQIVLHETSQRLSKQGLRDPKMTLKDLLIIGIEQFHLYLYLYGASFTVYTDHKPLQLIYPNPLSKPATILLYCKL